MYWVTRRSRVTISCKLNDTAISRGRTQNLVPPCGLFLENKKRAHSHFIARIFSYKDRPKRKTGLDLFGRRWDRMNSNEPGCNLRGSRQREIHRYDYLWRWLKQSASGLLCVDKYSMYHLTGSSVQ